MPSQWNSIGVPDPENIVSRHIGLKQRNIEGLQRKLLDISNPESPNYGRWLSKEEVEKYTTPTAQTTNSVNSWLEAAGVDASSLHQPSPDWIQVTLPLHQAEELLQARYSVYQDSHTGHTLVRTPDYSLPAMLHDHVDTIQPTTTFQSKQLVLHGQEATELETSSDCTKVLTPQCIRDFYYVDYKGKGLPPFGVTGLGHLQANHTDLGIFLLSYDPATDPKYQFHGCLRRKRLH